MRYLILLTFLIIQTSEPTSFPINVLHKAVPHEYPFMVMICKPFLSYTSQDWKVNNMVCQGTLVSPKWVLTISSCNVQQYNMPLIMYEILADFTDEQDIRNAKHAIITEWFSYAMPQRISSFAVDDIALCKLNIPIHGVKLMELPLKPIIKENYTHCSFIGWRKNKRLISNSVHILDSVELYNKAKLVGIELIIYVLQHPQLEPEIGGALVCNDVQMGMYLAVTKKVAVYTNIERYTKWLGNVLKLESDYKNLALLQVVEYNTDPYVYIHNTSSTRGVRQLPPPMQVTWGAGLRLSGNRFIIGVWGVLSSIYL